MNLLSLLVTQVTTFDRGRIGPTTLVALGKRLERPLSFPDTYLTHRLIEAMLENYNGNTYVD
ncbi:gp103 [Erwinia phage vB_EamP-S6]|uniref:Gp103 n=1 Tax=Erwinia phage vB_EamP-S6 TaxID=1051675 RepID=G0YQJ5_9CAUD|nr:gp103 [Erwinia phage vB_EamP-S6]AEJ81622.1 gp103 [Erwinia phage vB_EamP-S6]